MKAGIAEGRRRLGNPIKAAQGRGMSLPWHQPPDSALPPSGSLLSFTETLGRSRDRMPRRILFTLWVDTSEIQRPWVPVGTNETVSTAQPLTICLPDWVTVLSSKERFFFQLCIFFSQLYLPFLKLNLYTFFYLCMCLFILA